MMEAAAREIREDLREPLRPMRRSRRLDGWILIARRLGGISTRHCRRLAAEGIITVKKRHPDRLKSGVYVEDDEVLAQEWARYRRWDRHRHDKPSPQ